MYECVGVCISISIKTKQYILFQEWGYKKIAGFFFLKKQHITKF